MAALPVMDRSTPTATAQRRFRLLDAMILAAATALGCVLVQWMGRVTQGGVSWSAFYPGVRGYLG